MQIVDNKALLITTKKADTIASLIPKSQIIERNGEKARVLVYWGYEECKILRNLKIKNVPNPIHREYAWPGFYKPMSHQRDMAAFMAAHHRCYNLSTMGVGKTSAAAWAADYLMSKKIIQRVLVLCPLSIMQSAWQADLFKTVMHRTVGIAHGSREQRKRVIEADYDFVIMNHDGVKVMRKELTEAEFDLIIIDELNVFKNSQSDRSKALMTIIKADTWVWGMTGTPAAQCPTDAYGLAKIVRPDSVPQYFKRFRDSVLRQVTTYKWVPKDNAKDTVFATLQPAIRFTKEECLDLPEITYTTRDVPLTTMQEKFYNRLKNQMRMEAAGLPVTAANAAVLINKLLQISAGGIYSEEKEVVEFDTSTRYAELLELINQTDQKAIVFVPFKHVIDVLSEKLTADGISNGFINGDVPLSKRTELFKNFQTEDDPKVLLIQPQAAAHGVTLTAADLVVWWGPVASTETYLQANARAHRHGQKNKVTVVHLQGSAAERRIFKLLQGNIDVHNSIVDLYKEELGLT